MVCQTDVIDDHSSPRWLPWTKRGFVFHTAYPSSVINLGVFDYDPGLPLLTSHDLVGRASVDLTNFRPGTEYELHYDLHNTSTAENRRKEGIIKVSIVLEPLLYCATRCRLIFCVRFGCASRSRILENIYLQALPYLRQLT
jgi:hypothetical protein